MNSNAQLSLIAELDLEPIKLKVMHKESGEGWSLAQANAVEFEYRRFLSLMTLYPDEHVSPLYDVDLFWHYHILDTMKYAEDCQRIFGYFLHHYPYSGLLGEEDEADHQRTGERMQELYEATFGEAYIRPEHAVMSWFGAAPETAWSNPTIGDGAPLQGRRADTASYTSATQDPVSLQGANPKTAWSNPTTGNRAPAKASSPKTAWSNPTVGNAARLQGATPKTAWSNPTIGNRTRSQAASPTTAWSNPTVGNAAWLQGATPKTAWSNPTTGNRPRSTDAAAMPLCPATTPQNEAFFARASMAGAA